MNEIKQRELFLSMLFKIAFLKSMLPVMTLSDVEGYLEVVKRTISGDLIEEDVTFIDKLFDKFGKKENPNAN